MLNQNAQASTRLRAADLVLSHSAKAIEIEDIETRVADVERSAESAKGEGDAVRCAQASTAYPKARITIEFKPCMQRRIWATLAVLWSEVSATLASPRMSLDEYFTPELDAAKIVNIMMGNLQRIWVYG